MKHPKCGSSANCSSQEIVCSLAQYLENDLLTMCAINGIYAYHYAANDVSIAEVLKSRDAMVQRGPDDCGIWQCQAGRVALGHRRLSVLDLSRAGAQPMHSACGRFVITYNGEIYNYRQLRSTLERQGQIFRGHSDTEVLLALFQGMGSDMVERLRGMFALAIWDKRDRSLFLARDPLGIKPLYIADDGWTFRFSSQVKSLLAGGAVSRDPDVHGRAGFFLWGAVPEPYTTYSAIRSFPAGSHMLVSRIGQLKRTTYFSVAHAVRRAETASAVCHSDRHATRLQVATAVRDSVASHLVADVSFGAFLSAGIDSGALVGLMRDCTDAPIATTTLRFEDFKGKRNDEGPLARRMAELFGTRHKERVISTRELEADLPNILEAMDQPSIDGVNTWFVAKAAREQGLKVAISGVGGDELFGGYSSFDDIPRWTRSLGWLASVPGLGWLVRQAVSQICHKTGLHPKAAGLISMSGRYSDAYILRRGLFMPWEIDGLFAGDLRTKVREALRMHREAVQAVSDVPQTAYGKIAALEMSFYLRNQLLRDADWASMAHGVEVRVPLVDRVLFERVMPLLVMGNMQRRKHLLAQAPSTPMPRTVMERSKTGFSIPVGALSTITAGTHHGLTLQSLPHRSALWSRQWAHFIASQTMLEAV